LKRSESIALSIGFAALLILLAATAANALFGIGENAAAPTRVTDSAASSSTASATACDDAKTATAPRSQASTTRSASSLARAVSQKFRGSHAHDPA
jgi:hypothetical protein